MTVESNDLEQALKKKGFDSYSGDHKYYRLYVEGRATSIQTRVSHGPKHTISGGILDAVKKQMGLLTSRELHDFVRCPLTKDDYIGLLAKRGKITLSSQ